MKKTTSIVVLLAIYVVLILGFFAVTTLRKAASPPPDLLVQHEQIEIVIKANKHLGKHLTVIPNPVNVISNEAERESEGFKMPDVDALDISVYILLTLGLYAGKRWIDWMFKKKEIILQHEIEEEPTDH